MLRGHESLIRIVGKRRQDVKVPVAAPRNDQEEGFKEILRECSSEDVECPVCAKKLHDAFINEHLDMCLANGTKRRRVQLTIMQFTSITPKSEASEFSLKNKHYEERAAAENFDFDYKAAITGDEFCRTELASSLLNEETMFSGCLETKVVGRKFNKGAQCESGMQILLVREPENSKDTRAIKVVSNSDSNCILGHIPRRLSFFLAPLLDKGVIEIKGYVKADPENSFDHVHLQLVCKQSEIAVKDKFLITCWKNAVQSADNAKEVLKEYQENFISVVDTVLQRDFHLFTDEESSFLGSSHSLSRDALRLFIRLSQRKGPWFRLSNISYAEVNEVDTAAKELIDTGFFVEVGSLTCPKAFKELLDVLNVQELRQIINNTLCSMTGKAKRDELVEQIIDGQFQGTLTDKTCRVSLLLSVMKITGTCVRLSDQASFLLWRLQRLFFLNGEQDLSTFVLVDMGRVTYPVYNCTREMPIFTTREALVAYEQALHLAQVMDMSIEANDLSSQMNTLAKARIELENSGDTETNHIFLSRYSATWIYTAICSLGVSILERERRYGESVSLLKLMLRKIRSSGKRGYWTVRLSIDLEHLGRTEESLEIAENGTEDEYVRSGDRICLQKRVVRLSKPPRRWKLPSYASTLKHKHKVVEIKARPLSNSVGMKNRYYGYDGEQCSVEELALQYYGGEGWKGVHSESGVWLTLFGLLMWDIIFADVPHVFQTPFQNAPLDMDTEAFYPVRRDLIEDRVKCIANGRGKEMMEEIWTLHYGKRCRGVNWERQSFDELQTIVTCVGGEGLAAICKLLAMDYAARASGMPDLLLWRTGRDLGNDEAKLVEVKGPSDRLSDCQLGWIIALSNAAIPFEVCKVSKQI